MKELLVVLLIAVGLLSLIIGLDYIMGASPQGLVWKAFNPFRVMEAAEYLIVLLFVLVFVIKSLSSYIKKKRKSQSPTN